MDIKTVVRQALDGEAAPSSCPDGKLYVPAPARSQVLEWGHSSRLSGHPGTGCTLSFLQRKLEMREDVQNFVSDCSVCTQFKVTHQPPQGLLQPLPIPHRPWSHIALDFVTGLPTSNHNTTILTIIDRFSKAVHFIPLPKLPSASGTAHLLIQHIVRLHGGEFLFIFCLWLKAGFSFRFLVLFCLIFLFVFLVITCECEDDRGGGDEPEGEEPANPGLGGKRVGAEPQWWEARTPRKLSVRVLVCPVLIGGHCGCAFSPQAVGAVIRAEGEVGCGRGVWAWWLPLMILFIY